MSKTQIPKVAGVLLIGPGVVQVVLSTCVLLLFFVSMDSLIRIAWGYSIGYAIILGPLIISGAFAIVGGTYAQKEKLWSLILTGAIFALFPCVWWVIFLFLLGSSMITGSVNSLSLPSFFGLSFAFFLVIGIATITMTVLSKKQFE